MLVHRLSTIAVLWLVSILSGGPTTSPAGSSGTTSGSLPAPGAAIPSIPIVAGESVRVLFVGNSLTQANDLPMMVTALAAAAGVQIQATDVSQGGFSLEDHFNDLRAPHSIDRGGWHFVILQQGPSALLSSCENLRLWAARFNERIRAVGGRPALYMVWPEAARITEFGNVRQSYLLAAQHINGLFLPAGDTRRAAWKRNPALKLYGSDDFHPSMLGTYAAAIVITARITSHSPVDLPNEFNLANGMHVAISAAEAQTIQAAAAEVLRSE